MADDIQDLGSSTVLFPFDPNWVSPINGDFDIIRHFVRYPGGASYMTDRNEFTPVSWSAQYTFYTKEDESDFLTFMNARKGNAHRFWALYPKTVFEMKSAWSGSDITCHANHFNSVSRGVERIFVTLKNGDLLTRKASSVAYDSVNDEIVITAGASPASPVYPVDVVQFGLMYLVRFDTTRFKVSSPADVVGRVNLDFYELDEYEDSDL